MMKRTVKTLTIRNTYRSLTLRALCLLLLLLRLSAAMAGGNYRFTHLTSAQGLPHQQVEALAQDARGHIWIGMRNGLVRYDGYSTKVYSHDEKNPHSLPNDYIWALHVDRRHRLRICTETGICRYRPETDDFEYYKNVRGLFWTMAETSRGTVFFGGGMLCSYHEADNSIVKHPLPTRAYVNSMAVDAADNLYISTSTSIFSYNADMTRITRLNPAYYQDCLKSNNVIMPVFFDHAGRLWIGRNGKGAVQVDLKTGRRRYWLPGQMSDGMVRTITEDASHRIWMGTENGITVIYPDGHTDILRHHFRDKSSLGDNAIYAILCDRQQNMWIGSYFGGVDIMRKNNGQFTYFEPGNSADDIKARVPRMMTEPTSGTFWIATEDGGINIYNHKTGRFTVFRGIPNLGTNIHSLYYDRSKKEMWIGTRFNGLFRYNMVTHACRHYMLSHGLTSEGVFYIARQHSGRLWFATMQGLLYYDPRTDSFKSPDDGSLRNAFVYTICIDRDDNVWAGTTNGGIFKVPARGGRIVNWRADERHGLKDNYIISLFQDSRGTMWVGTNSNGLQYVDRRSGTIRSLGNGQQLSKCTVCSIIEDDMGRLWISSNLGLFSYNTRNRVLNRFSIESGLPVNVFNFSSSLSGSGGLMLFGTTDGLITLNPRRITKEAGPFSVHMKQLVIGNRAVTTATPDTPLNSELDAASSITLSYDQARSFSIEYGVIMPGEAEAISYQVFLEGIDKGWRNVGNDRSFKSYNLPSGTYVLHVRANNSNEGWECSPIKTLRIVVKPPFYRSVWAYVLYFLLVVLLCWLAYHLFNIRLKARNAVKMARLEKEKIEEIDKVKSDFFTTVSHELKTPLSLIVAPLKSMSRQNIGTEIRKHLDMAIRNTRKMEGLINELVTFNKLETDSLPFFIQKGNPVEFIEKIARQFVDAAAGKRVGLLIDSENNGEDVWFSASYLEHIVNNLLSNALKFTLSGGQITVKSSICTLPEKPGLYLRLTVSDTGVGIEPEEQSYIFDRYYQTRRGYNASTGGWGIGLSLVKRLTEIHQGTISVQSEVDKGSVFTVLLDVSPEAFSATSRMKDSPVLHQSSNFVSEEETGGAALTSGTDTRKEHDDVSRSVSVLLVEDNPDMLSFLKDYFSSSYHILTAVNGCEALRIAQAGQADLVVSDVMMPEMDGTELCRRMKHDMSTSHIPVILLTARGETEDVLAGYESGAEAYVQKPFDPQILGLQIKNILQLQTSRQHEMASMQGRNIDALPLSELDKKLLRQINNLIDKNIGNSDFSISDMTENLGISRSLLHAKMKNLLGLSAGDYLRNKRMEHACQLLRSGCHVSETAYRSGFADPNYFSKAFRKYTGKSPTEFINN